MQSGTRFKVWLCLNVVALTGLVAQSAMAQGGPIVVSQLFGGAGSNAAAANGDFVELFNRSCVTINLTNYSVQVASGSAAAWNAIPLPNFELDPGEYYLIRLTTTATGTPYTADLSAPGQPTGFDLMTSSSGRAAIVVDDAPLPNGACLASARIVDFARYDGTATACIEGLSFGVALGGPTAGRSVSRKTDVNGNGQGDGCQDTNVNNNDFMADIDPAAPRNNASGTNVCPGAPIFGGCNLESGSCLVTFGAGPCTAQGGTYLGDCTPCESPQACCLPTTPVTCVVETQAECAIDGGVYNPGQFSCPPTPACPPLGRCCSLDGTCVVTFEVLCVAPDTYGGNGTNCVGTPCQGRCCGLDGSCNVVGPNQCVAPSTFGGVGTNCANPALCQGRCCEPDGDCTLTGSTNCLAPNSFGGVGSTCQDLHTYGDPQPIPVVMPAAGAAPPSIITVADNFIVQDVDVMVKVQHSFRDDAVLRLQGPDGIIVPLTGVTDGICGGEDNINAIFDDESAPVVCNNPNLANLAADPVRIFTTPAGGLTAFDGLPSVGEWTLLANDIITADVGTVLDWALILDSGDACKGACCLPNTSCIRTGQEACVNQGGTFNGNGSPCSPSPCAPNGACCVVGTCSLQSAIDCGINNGVFAGVGSNCDTPPCLAPCCRQDGTCTELTLAACAAIPNATAGALGASCPSGPCIGACCAFNGGECTMQTPGSCVAPDVFAGSGTTCATVECSGRCCLASGACSVTSPGQCAGTFTIGQTCDPLFVAEFPNINLLIPLGQVGGGYGPVAQNIQTLTGIAGTITDVDVDALVQHTWAGDVRIDIEHLGTIVTIIDLPGHLLPDAAGCAQDNLDVIIDDEGSGGPIETQCALTPPAALSPPNFTPESAPGTPYSPGGLSAFDGLDPNGAWTISVSDGFDLDSGMLLGWSLHISHLGDVCGGTGGCTCFGDMNNDGGVSGKDVMLFAQCVAAGGAGCACGDMNHAGGATSADVPLFVTALLTGTCGAP